MSNTYYHERCLKLFDKLKETVTLDRKYQIEKYHDKKLCEAVRRLGGIFGAYCCIYNDLIECLDQSLQVQKTSYIKDILNAVIKRILELKRQLKHLEASECSFYGNGLIDHKLTPQDVEFIDVSNNLKRPREMQILVDSATAGAKAKIEEIARIMADEQKQTVEVKVVPTNNWWECSENQDDLSIFTENDVNKDDFTVTQDEEWFKEQQLVKLIQAQERSRQTYVAKLKSIQKRDIFIKGLKGTLKPQANLGIRKRSAGLIMSIYRAYMQAKRNHIHDYGMDKILGLTMPSSNKELIETREMIKIERSSLRQVFELQWERHCKKIKQNFMNKKGASIKDDISDEIRNWFRIWYEKYKLFHDIPRAVDGGTKLVVTEEIATPEEWLEEFEKESKEKSSMQAKMAITSSNMEAANKKKAELIKKRLEAKLLKKMMKNPNLHPGYHYPPSKYTEDILKRIDDYFEKWHEFDSTLSPEVLQKFIPTLDLDEMYKNVHLELRHEVDEDMRLELKMLRKALRNDFKKAQEKMPKLMASQNFKKTKRPITTKSGNLHEKFEHLVLLKIIKEYPKTRLRDFKGEYNFAGDDIRCASMPTSMFAGELRSLWWETCKQFNRNGGSRGILLTGQHGSGKTILVNTLATSANAVLFDLSPYNTAGEEKSRPWLRQTFSSVLSIAKAVQPSVIYIEDVHKLFYRKIPNEEKSHNLNLTRQCLIRNCIKKIAKEDKIIIIGTSTEPWLAKQKGLLKIFPRVVLVPDTNYTTVVQMLNIWVESCRHIPKNFNTQSLAKILEGYSYDFIESKLEEFLSPRRLISMAVKPLEEQDVLNFIFDDPSKCYKHYSKHKEWYFKYTRWGIKENKRLQDEKSFNELTERIKAAKEDKFQAINKITDNSI